MTGSVNRFILDLFRLLLGCGGVNFAFSRKGMVKFLYGYPDEARDVASLKLKSDNIDIRSDGFVNSIPLS